MLAMASVAPLLSHDSPHIFMETAIGRDHSLVRSLPFIDTCVDSNL